MRPLQDAFTIVVLGAWNPSIFSPEWVKQNLADSDQSEVTLAFPIDDATAPRRISFDGINVFPGRRQILLNPKTPDVEGMNKCSSVLVKILGLLKHTPLTSAGVNLTFAEDTPSALMATALLPSDSPTILADYQVNDTNIQRALKRDADDFVINFGLVQNGAGCKLSFNFHYDIANVEGYVQLFSGEAVEGHFTTAIGLASQFYEIELEVDGAEEDV